MCGVFPPLLTQTTCPTPAALRPHFLRPLPGETGQHGRRDPDYLLPPVPLDHLHSGQPDPAGGFVGQHRDLGSNGRERAEENEGKGGFGRGCGQAAHQANVVSRKIFSNVIGKVVEALQ